MAISQRLSVLACLAFTAACGSTADAGKQTPGGAPGKPCSAVVSPVGCYVDATGANIVVSCPADVSPSTWVAGETCAAGTHCNVNSKTDASCVANPVIAGKDTVSGSDTAGDTSASLKTASRASARRKSRLAWPMRNAPSRSRAPGNART